MFRKVFFVSDGTGITAANLGHSLLTQFETTVFDPETIPYVNTIEKAQQAVDRINDAFHNTEQRPLVFTTIIDPTVIEILKQSKALVLDFFQAFIGPLESELKCKSSHTVGKTHGVKNYNDYMIRIEAVNYALTTDDGVNAKDYAKADVILLGVSRSGKTPTCLYLALHFGLFAANYPLTLDDMPITALPKFLRPFRNKIFGLTIDPSRLAEIRSERRPNSDYADLARCRREVKEVEDFYARERITCINASTRSIEEIASLIVAEGGIKKRLYL